MRLSNKTKNNNIFISFAKKIRNNFLFLLVPLVFFSIAIVTIGDYGINWDSPVHFARGQALLRYLFTGKTNYNGMIDYCRGNDGFNSRVDYKTGEVCDKHRKVRRSEYESFLLDFEWAKKDIGHPAFSDDMLALSNQIFFKALGWFEDVEAYHLYNIFMTFILAILIAYWSYKSFGLFSAIISSLSFYLFPLLLGEQHFNIKDPPLAAFFTLGIFFFYLSIIKNNVKYMYISAVFGGMSFATKINYVFAPIILFPWFIVYFFHRLNVIKLLKAKSKKKFIKIISSIKKIQLKFILALILYPIIIISVFYFSWPAIWFNTKENLEIIIKFYQSVGVRTCPYDKFTLDWVMECSDLFAIKYILYTMPIVSLIFFASGIIFTIKYYKVHAFALILWLSFFIVTVGRVTFSIASIYGGLRQILEFIAPFALIAGFGAFALRNFIANLISRFIKFDVTIISNILSVLFVLLYIPLVITMVKMHPNENLYYNAFVGGFKGAAEKKIPGYGNTYGNSYAQGVKWLNKNAVKNTRLSLLSGLGQNISRGTLREDISFTNVYRSGYNQNGEYLMLPIAEGDPAFNSFRYKYADKFLDPVYVLKVQDVPILKIWKNDKDHVKKGIDINSEQKVNSEVNIKEDEILIQLSKVVSLKRVEIDFENNSCKDVVLEAPIFISEDSTSFVQMPEVVNDANYLEVNTYPVKRVLLFTGEKANTIKIIPKHIPSCQLNEINFSVVAFVNI